MTQEHWSDRLSAYLDGELSVEDRVRADAHLDACAACRGELAAFREIQAAARAAPGAPTSDPWPAIAAVAGGSAAVGTAQSGAARGGIPWLARAAALLLAAGVAGASWWALSNDEPGRLEPTTAVLDRVAVEDPGVEAARLERRFLAMSSQLDPRTVATVEASLERLNAALARIEAELAADRDNPLLQALAERARRQKLRVLQRVVSS